VCERLEISGKRTRTLPNPPRLQRSLCFAGTLAALIAAAV
jgi:hypothetical protein